MTVLNMPVDWKKIEAFLLWCFFFINLLLYPSFYPIWWKDTKVFPFLIHWIVFSQSYGIQMKQQISCHTASHTISYTTQPLKTSCTIIHATHTGCFRMTEKKFDHIDKAKRNLDTGTSVFLARATEGTSLYVSLRQLVSQCVSVFQNSY